jgi:hypothetical protein
MLLADAGHAFSIDRFAVGQQARITRGELAQDGMGVGNSREQLFDQGNPTRNITSFADPIDLGMTVTAPGVMTGQDTDTRFVRIRLSAAERALCLDEGDFVVSLRVSGPVADQFTAAGAGGFLTVTNFVAQFTTSNGGACPNQLIYGYRLAVNVDNAVSDDRYRGDVEVAVIGPSDSQTLQTPLVVNMPNILFLYHFDSVSLDVQTAAISDLVAGAPCTGDTCVDVGTSTFAITDLSGSIDVDIEGAAPTSNMVPTVTLDGIVGVRALGCGTGTYAQANYSVTNVSGGIVASTGTIADIQGSNCSFLLSTGGVQFDIDLSATGGAATARADIEITVNGL